MTSKELARAELIARRMNPVFAKMWNLMWPKGHCGVASLCLAPLLRSSLQLDFRVVVGRAYDCRKHAWIESPEGDIIDPTYGQFDNKYPLRVLPAGAAGSLGHCGEIRLDLDQEEQLRRSIEPRHVKGLKGPKGSYGGWNAKSGIRELFSDYPRAPQREEQ